MQVHIEANLAFSWTTKIKKSRIFTPTKELHDFALTS